MTDPSAALVDTIENRLERMESDSASVAGYLHNEDDDETRNAAERMLLAVRDLRSLIDGWRIARGEPVRDR